MLHILIAVCVVLVAVIVFLIVALKKKAAAANPVEVGFLEERKGVKSSTRLNLFIILINGLVCVDAIIAGGIYELVKYQKITLMDICLAAGALFVSVVVPCITWKTLKDSSEKTPDPAPTA
jgi:hypothetical protein